MITNVGQKIREISAAHQRKDVPEFNVGDYVKMKVKVEEGDKTRLHPYEGTVICKTDRGVHSTFTVRKISFGEGVERIFPLHSPSIDTLKVMNKGVAKRAKLYYLRGRVGKKAKGQTEAVQK